MNRIKTKLVCNIGINDAAYPVRTSVNGKTITCPIYKRWALMLERVYDPRKLEKAPWYKGTSVCTEWLTFSNFAEWFAMHFIEGWELDKDLRIKGNKQYSPSTCLFIPQELNCLLGASTTTRGKYPQGVSAHRSKYGAYISINGKKKWLGAYDSPEEASEIYRKAKNENIKKKAIEFPQFSKYLTQHFV